MRRWGSGMARINTRVSLATTLLRHLRRSPPFVAATAASSTPPPPIHLRISVALLAPKAFLATAFLMLGRRNVVLWITLERHTPRSGQERRLCMGMVSGAWLFTSHQEPGSLISGRGWRCPTVVCGWSPVTLGPAFELVTLRGGFQTSTGGSVTGLVMVPLELEHAHGARRGGIRAYRGMQSTLAGGSHVAWRTLRMDRVYKCLKDCLRRCTGLGASQGAVQGASRLGSSRECSKGSAGGLVRGRTCTRRSFECISVAAQARWRSGQDGGTRRRCINLHCRGTRRLMKLT